MSILALAQLGLVELWRHRLSLLPLVVALCLGLGLYLAQNVVPAHAGPSPLQGTIAWVCATQILPTIGSILGVLAASGAIAGEVERGTALLLATRQPRWVLILGKTAGVYAFLLASFAAWTVVLVGAWVLQGHYDNAHQLALAAMLGVLPGCLTAAVTLAVSTIASGQAATAAVVTFFMVKGLASGLIGTGALEKRPLIEGLAKGLVKTLPTEQLGEIGTKLAIGPGLLTEHYLAAIAPIAWLALGMLLFSRRDL
jgi:ABC-type transport system involved in multi-copper enzyme maturation permease subunit